MKSTHKWRLFWVVLCSLGLLTTPASAEEKSWSCELCPAACTFFNEVGVEVFKLTVCQMRRHKQICDSFLGKVALHGIKTAIDKFVCPEVCTQVCRLTKPEEEQALKRHYTNTRRTSANESKAFNDAVWAYKRMVRGYNEGDPVAYFHSFGAPMRCYYDKGNMSFKELVRRKSKYFNNPTKNPINLSGLGLIKREASANRVVFTVKWRRIKRKIIVMEKRGGTWKIVVEAGQQVQSCYPWSLRRNEHD